jgi:hypothetical protein
MIDRLAAPDMMAIAQGRYNLTLVILTGNP